MLHCGLCGDTEQLHSLQQSYLLPPRPPSPAPAIQNNITPSNIHEPRCCSQGPLLQVAVTSVIAQYFPPQRKIVFIMCHEHRAKQSPLEWFPKGWREVVLNLNRRFWLRFFFLIKKKGEASESSSLTLLLSATKKQKLMRNSRKDYPKCLSYEEEL